MTAWSGESWPAGASTASVLADDALRALQPNADSVDGSWTDQSGGTSLAASIDEMLPDDSDFIFSAKDPSGDICKVALSNPGGTPQAPFIVQYRFRRSGSGTRNFGVRLLQGSTEIAAWTHGLLNSSSDSYVTASQTLTAPQLASISDFSDLYLEFNADAYQGPGDIVGSALAWWGLRAYTTASVGNNAIRLRRSSDNAESNFVTVTGGGLDLDTATTGIKDWGAGSTLYVVKLYDQSGNAVDMAQATAGAQPQFVLSRGNVLLPAILGASGKVLTSTATITQAQPFTGCAAVVFSDITGTPQEIFSQDSPAQITMSYNISGQDPPNYASIYDSAAAFSLWGPCARNRPHVLAGIWGDSNTHRMYGDGSQLRILVDNTVGGFGLSSTMNLLSFRSTADLYPWTGYFMEFGLWAGAMSETNIISIQTNQMIAWDIENYVGPGDLLGPSAVYAWNGLRAYTQASIGCAVIRLRRTSDNAERDFVAGDNGALDYGDIVAWRDALGSADARMSYLYDQIRVTSQNNLYQNVAAAQPTFIVNGLGQNAVLRFAAADTGYIGSVGVYSLTQPYTISDIVARSANFSTLGWIFWGGAPTVIIRYVAQPNRIEMVGSASFSAPIYDSIAQSVTCVFNGSSSKLNINGVSNLGDVGTGDLSGGSIIMFESNVGPPYFEGDFAEHGAWSVALTDTQMANLYANQRAFWGTTF